MCAKRLEREPRDSDALALMSRLCLLAGDAGAAIACASLAVRIAPSHAASRAALESAGKCRTDPGRASALLHEALRLEPEITAYNVCYASAPPFAAIERARALLEDALQLDPGSPELLAALANVYSRQDQTLLAIQTYRRSLDIDPRPDVALALSELLYNVGDYAASDEYRAYALSQQQLCPAGPGSAEASRRVLVLNAPAAWAQNTPLEFMIDPHTSALHRLYLTDDLIPVLPPYDVVFNAIGEAERAHHALAAAERFIASQDVRVINRPEHLWKTARPHLAGALANVRVCLVPRTRRIARDELGAAEAFPLLARPIDTHAGRGLERLDDRRSLDAYLEAHTDDRFDVTPFVEYRSPDGYYRKYRVVLVDGTPYPYHLAISSEWMVHYIKTPTASVDWMRQEEERFLRDPASVFPHWERTFAEIAQAVGLEYFGVDCSLLPDGNVLVFEADAALLVHCREPADSYKHQYVPRIFRAVEELLRRTP